MGLLGKWFKNKRKEQLNATSSVVLETEQTQKTTTRKNVAAVSSAYRVIKKPFVSEKAGSAEMHGTYTFVVPTDASKTHIKHTIKELYGVMPLKVATMQLEGKCIRFGYKHGRRSDWKKAIITLAKGLSIDIHEGV
ncbi:MAG: 50S ribosomal protein L23 [Candidatus Magasanikbacteria bacterium]|nr:50S ribosomal protein L23 [Candidatus Magasanikbacteria bacterium]